MSSGPTGRRAATFYERYMGKHVLYGAAAALLFACAGCSDDDLDEVALPVGATFVSQRISRDLAFSEVPDSSAVTLQFMDDDRIEITTPPNTCLSTVERTGPVSWRVGGPGGCTEVCCATALTDEIEGVLFAGELRFSSGTITAGNGRTAVIFE